MIKTINQNSSSLGRGKRTNIPSKMLRDKNTIITINSTLAKFANQRTWDLDVSRKKEPLDLSENTVFVRDEDGVSRMRYIGTSRPSQVGNKAKRSKRTCKTNRSCADPLAPPDTLADAVTFKQRADFGGKLWCAVKADQTARANKTRSKRKVDIEILAKLIWALMKFVSPKRLGETIGSALVQALFLLSRLAEIHLLDWIPCSGIN